MNGWVLWEVWVIVWVITEPSTPALMYVRTRSCYSNCSLFYSSYSPKTNQTTHNSQLTSQTNHYSNYSLLKLLTTQTTHYSSYSSTTHYPNYLLKSTDSLSNLICDWQTNFELSKHNRGLPFLKPRKPWMSGWVGVWWTKGSFDFAQIQVLLQEKYADYKSGLLWVI